MKVESIEITAIKQYLQQKFPNMYPGIEIQVFPELEQYDAMGVRMIMYWWGKQEASPITYPTDWWQAVKARWFPRWLKKLSSVKCTTEHKYRICPHINEAWAANKAKHMMWMKGEIE